MKKLVFLLLVIAILNAGFSTDEDIYSINSMTISGDLETNTLSFQGSGNVLNSNNVKIYLLGSISNIVITRLTVNGLSTPVSFDSRGYFFIANSGFNFSGSFDILSLGQLSLSIPGPVRELNFDLINGYVVGGDKLYSQLNNIVIIQRQEIEQVLVDADFHFIFDESENNFIYDIDFSSLGDSLSSYTLRLKNSENLESVTGALDYSLNGNNLVLELTGSKDSVTISGTFSSANLLLPIAEGTHDVLIESHPEKKLSLNTNAEIIDLSESSITPNYFNSQAFLADYLDYFYITLQDLTLLPSLTFSVSDATNRVALSEKGTVLGQLSYDYANSGEEYIELSVPGTPLYSATNRKSIMLTKEDESLFLAIPKTNYGSLDVTYLEILSPPSLFYRFDVPLINSSMPISEMSTSVYLPQKYFVLWTFGADYGEGSELPGITTTIIFFAVAIILGSLLNKNKSFIIRYVIALTGLLFVDFGLLVLAYIASSVLILKNRINKKNYIKFAIAGAIILVIGFVLSIILTSSLMLGSDTYYRYAGESVQSSSAAPDFSGIEKSESNEAGSITITTETGVLPVDFEIPRMGKTITLTTSLVTLENPVNYSMILINSDLRYLFIIVSGVLIFNIYKKYFKK